MARVLPPSLAARWTGTKIEGMHVAENLPHLYLLDCQVGARFWAALQSKSIVMTCTLPGVWSFYTQQPKDWFKPNRPSKLFGFGNRMDPLWELLGGSTSSRSALKLLLVCFEPEGLGLGSADHAAARFVRAAPADYERWLQTQPATRLLPKTLETRYVCQRSLEGEACSASGSAAILAGAGEPASATDTLIVLGAEGAMYMPGNFLALESFQPVALPAPP